MKEQQVTTVLKLPFLFDEKRLLKDLNLALSKHWTPHFNQGGYEGEWNSIALYAIGGEEKNILAMPTDEAPLEATPIMKDCHFFQEVLAHFKCELLSARLLQLNPGAIIKPHRDFELGYEDNNFRIHVPITTNSQVEFVLDGQRLNMLPGECWYTNVNYVHSVANKGETSRVHLVFDGKRNDWSDELFFSLAPKESFFQIKKKNMMLKLCNELLKN